MTLNIKSELPFSGILSQEEKAQARAIIADSIKQKNKEIETSPNNHLFYLLNYEEGGDEPYSYKMFIQDLLYLMLIPENAKVLYEKHRDAGKLFDNLIEFFDGLHRNESTFDWCDFSLAQKTFPDAERIYWLWQRHVNTEQKIPNFPKESI